MCVCLHHLVTFLFNYPQKIRTRNVQSVLLHQGQRFHDHRLFELWRWAQSLTLLKAFVTRYKYRSGIQAGYYQASRCLYGMFPWRKGFVNAFALVSQLINVLLLIIIAQFLQENIQARYLLNEDTAPIKSWQRSVIKEVGKWLNPYSVFQTSKKRILMLLNNPESLTILIVEIPKLEQEMCSCIKVTDFMTADFMTLCKVVWSKSGRFLKYLSVYWLLCNMRNGNGFSILRYLLSLHQQKHLE